MSQKCCFYEFTKVVAQMIDLKCDNRYSVSSHCTFATLYTLAFKKTASLCALTHSPFHSKMEPRPPIAHSYGPSHWACSRCNLPSYLPPVLSSTFATFFHYCVFLIDSMSVPLVISSFSFLRAWPIHDHFLLLIYNFAIGPHFWCLQRPNSQGAS